MSAARRWAPSVIWGAIIMVATSLPGSALPRGPDIPGLDKVVHAGLYGTLGFLVIRAMTGRARPGMAMALAVIALIAAADEWHQQWIPGRSMDAFDWAADVAGATLGATLSLTAQSRREIRS
jgi:VanZ family protein